VLFVIVPPPFKSSVIGPFVVAVALSLVVFELALVLVALFEHQFAYTVLLVVQPTANVQPARSPFENTFTIHLILLPSTFISSFFCWLTIT
jgi:hypothetical protein